MSRSRISQPSKKKGTAEDDVILKALEQDFAIFSTHSSGSDWQRGFGDREVVTKLWVPASEQHGNLVWQLADVVGVSNENGKVVVARALDKVDDASLKFVGNHPTIDPTGAPVGAETEAVAFPREVVFSFDESHIHDIDNAALLNDLNEPALLHLLRRRFLTDKIYTFTGDIVIAINPYKEIPGLYKLPAPGSSGSSWDMLAKSRKHKKQLGQRKGKLVKHRTDLVPHIYEVAQKAYQNLLELKEDQSILINGESGAGKTETSKRMIQYLVTMSQNHRTIEKLRETDELKALERIETAIVQSNRILEAFGNACTVRNGNSSRFGKFIRISFEDSQMVRASVRHFLLEKSRIVRHGAGERNYHVFYQLVLGMDKNDLREKLGLEDFGQSCSDFRYLCPRDAADEPVPGSAQNRPDSISVPDDAKECRLTLAAMKAIGMSPEDGFHVWRTLAGILFLGNITFAPSKRSSISRRLSGQSPKTVVEDMTARKYLVKAAEALGASSPNDLLAALTTRKLVTGRRVEAMVLPLSPTEAAHSRDALAKFLYHSLLEWIVSQVNHGTGHATGKDKHDLPPGSGLNLVMPGQEDEAAFIGILDMFGFEVFERNSFEQLCVNYANEVLQKQFNQHVFVLEQQRYVREGIDWKMLTFQDNQPLIDMFEMSPGGVFHQLDQQGLLGARGSDMAFVSNLSGFHEVKKDVDKDSKQKSIARKSTIQRLRGVTGVMRKEPEAEPASKARVEASASRMSLLETQTYGDPKLIIRHYVGKITYDANGFLQKNNDALQSGLRDLLNECAKDYPFLSSILDQAEATVASSEATRMLVSKEVGAQHAPRRLANLQTVGRMFQAQIKELTMVLDSTVPHFIRCVKPNHAGLPMVWDGNLVLNQLRYLGVMETVRIRREGFPVRRSFAQIAERFGRLLKEPKDTQVRWSPGRNDRLVCKTILQGTLGRGSKGALWQCGNSKRATTVFLADVVLARLDSTIRKLEEKDEEIARKAEEERFKEETKRLGPVEAQRLAKERAKENARLQAEVKSKRAEKRAELAAKSKAKLERRRLLDELNAQTLAAKKRREDIGNVFQTSLVEFRKQLVTEQEWLKEEMKKSSHGFGPSFGSLDSFEDGARADDMGSLEERAMLRLAERAEQRISEAGQRQQAEVVELRKQIQLEEEKFAQRRLEWESLEQLQQEKLRREKEAHEKELERQATATRERLEREARALQQQRLEEIERREKETLDSFHARLAAIEEDFLAKLKERELEHRRNLEQHLRRSVDRMRKGEDVLVSLAEQQHAGKLLIQQAQSGRFDALSQEDLAATKVQAMVRGAQVREKLAAARSRYEKKRVVGARATAIQRLVRGYLARRRMEKVIKDREPWSQVLHPNESIVYSSLVLFKTNAPKPKQRRGSVLRLVGLGGAKTEAGKGRRRGSILRRGSKTDGKGAKGNWPSKGQEQVELIFTTGTGPRGNRRRGKSASSRKGKSSESLEAGSHPPRVIMVEPSSLEVRGVMLWDSKQTRAIATSEKDFVIRGMSRETGHLVEWQFSELLGSATAWVPVLRHALSTYDLVHYSGKLKLGSNEALLVKQGHLLLRVLKPKKGKWAERFFVLKGEYLIWYRNESSSGDSSKSNRVRIDSETKVVFPMDEDKPNCFDVKLMHLQPPIWLRMHCQTNKIRNDWLVAICGIAERAATQRSLEGARQMDSSSRTALENKVQKYRLKQSTEGVKPT